MDKLTRLITKLDEMLAQHPIQLLTAPSRRDEFEYGRACGIIEGYNRVRNELLAILNEDDNAKSRKSG